MNIVYILIHTYIYAHNIQFNLLISNILLINFKSDPTNFEHIFSEVAIYSEHEV
jgi:hypothetical protein